MSEHVMRWAVECRNCEQVGAFGDPEWNTLTEPEIAMRSPAQGEINLALHACGNTPRRQDKLHVTHGRLEFIGVMDVGNVATYTEFVAGPSRHVYTTRQVERAVITDEES